MKKIFAVLMALVMLVPVYADKVQKSMEEQLLKEQKKEVKKKVKEYKKGGWEIMGSRTMEVSLIRHYMKLFDLGDNGVEFSGISTKTKSKNVAEQMAINNATIKYAQKAGSTLKGRVISDMQVDDTEFEKFFAAYERLVEQKIENVMTPTYSVIHKNSDGTCEVQAFFIVDESKAVNARKAAVRSAVKEGALDSKYADDINSLVDDKIEE